MSSFSSRPQGEFSARFLSREEKKNPAPSRASCEPCSPGCEVSSPLVERLRLSHLGRSEPGGQKNKNENGTEKTIQKVTLIYKLFKRVTDAFELDILSISS